MGKGGGGTTQSTGTTYNTNIPEYAEPYVMNMLGATQKQLFNINDQNEITGFKDYKPYSSSADDYIAGFSPMQEQAMRTAASPEAFGQQVQGYMSPYMQNVVDIQKREAMRGAGIMGAQQQAQATNAGAFGGYREGIQRSENQRNLGTQMNDIQLKGQQMAFDNAQQQARMSQGQQMQYGAMQQQQEQQKINQRIQDFANASQYPLMQLGTMSNMLRGLPMQAQTTNQYVAAPNPITQGIGAAGAGASIYNAMKPTGAAGAAGGLPSEFKYASGGIASVPRFDVGGEVESQLESMDVEGLMKQAQESSSPTVRAMAKRILRERQMGQGADQAPQGMAGGGIIAFQAGALVPPPTNLTREERLEHLRAQLLAQPGDPEDAQRREKMAQVTQAMRMRQDKIDLPPKPDIPTLMRERALERQRNRAEEDDRRARGNEATAQLMADINSGAYVPQARVNSPPESAVANPINLPSVVAEQAAPAGIMAAPAAAAPVVAAPVVAAPVVAAPAAAAPAGIMAAAPNSDQAGEAQAQAAMAAAPATAVTPATAGIVDSIRNAQKTQQDIADKSLSSLVEEDKALRRSMGLDKNEGRQKYMTEQMAERANLKDEAERQRNMRLAQFFASWGSTPGSTLVAGMEALKKSIPGMIDDEKDAKKARREADKIIFELKEAERLEELGYVDRATAKKEKAAEQAQKYNQSLLQYQTSIEGDRSRAESSKYSADTSAAATKYSADTSAAASKYTTDANVRIADLRERSAALDRSANRTTADDNKKYSQYQAASQQEILVNNRIAAEENGKQHVADVKLVNDAKLMKPADMPEGYADKIAEARGRIEKRETNWNSQIETAKRNTEMAFSRVRGVEPPAPTATTRSPEDTAALNWANANKNDPRAAEIKKRLGVQ